MNSEFRIKKAFDAVAFMRKWRKEISEEIKGMTPKEEIAYFKKELPKYENKKLELKPILIL